MEYSNLTKYKVTAEFIIDTDNTDYPTTVDIDKKEFYKEIEIDYHNGNTELTQEGITRWYYHTPTEIIKFDKVNIQKVDRGEYID